MKIVHYPHPALRYKARPLPAIDRRVRLQVGEMLELMYTHRGLGLASPQVALPYQIFVMNETADPQQREHEFVCINPVILERRGSQEGDEGCLSFPELFQKVRRAKTVTVQFYDLEGQLKELTVGDLPARIFQHETDHLHGVLFIDKMGTISKLAARSALKDFERVYRRAQERGEVPPDAEIDKQLKALEAELDEEETDGASGEAPPRDDG